MASEPENLVLEMLRGIRAELAPMRGLPGHMAEFRSEILSPRADAASDFVTLNEKLDAASIRPWRL